MQATATPETTPSSAIRVLGLDDADAEIRAGSTLIDVREPHEFAAGHIPGAINLPLSQLEFRLRSDPALLERNPRIVMYCKMSGRSMMAANLMQTLGFRSQAVIAGGFDAWLSAGKPQQK